MFKFGKKENPENSSNRKKLYLANVSHEIRTPMNAIVGIANILLQKADDPETREYLKDMDTATRNLLMTINGIMDYESMTLGRVTIGKEAFDVTELIQEVASIAKINIGEKNVSFLVDADPGMPKLIEGDPLRIKQVLVHLLSNADKYTSEGLIRLGVHTKTDDKFCRLSFCVEDTGTGMSPEMLKIAAMPYEQASGSAGGLGMGLTISKTLVELMGGTLDIKSKEGVGTTISITLILPIVDEIATYSVKNPDGICVALFSSFEEEKSNVARLLERMGIRYVNILNAGELFVENERRKLTHIFMDYEKFKQLKEIEEINELNLSYVVFLDSVRQAMPFRNTSFIKRPVWYPEVAKALNGEGMKGAVAPVKKRATMKIYGARALVIDDNSINLKVIQGLLEPYGLTVDMASSAEEGIRFVNKTRYDIVFIDYMMPGINGLQASRIIREFEDIYYKMLPIVAISANAVEGMEEAFLEAGVNDFIAKPITNEDLERCLRKWISSDKIEVNAAKEEEKKQPAGIFDALERIDVSKGLSYSSGKMDMYMTLLKEFAATIQDKKELLNSLITEEDISRFTIEVHSLKSNSKLVGASELSDKALELERLGHKRDFDGIVSKLPSLNDEIDEVMKELSLVIKEDVNVKRVPVDREKVRGLLRSLFYAAEDTDDASTKRICYNLGNYKYEEHLESVYKQLKLKVEERDYAATKRLSVEMLANI